MRDEKIASALRAETEKKRKGRHRQPVSVQGHVRGCLPEILDAREVMTWDEIAGTMTKAGLRWANGNPLTGKQLRNIASRMRQAERADGVSARPVRNDRKSGGEFTAETAASAGRRVEGAERGTVKNNILEEIKAAQKERQ